MVRAFLLPSSTAVGSCCQHIEKSIGILTGFVKLYETMEPTSKQSLNSNCTCGSNASGAKLGQNKISQPYFSQPYLTKTENRSMVKS